jgi:hypothetical protein
MKTTLYLLLVICLLAITSMAQPRPVEKTLAKPAATGPAPTTVTAKYEGGMFGFSKKMAGTLKFDDLNSRIVFYGEDQKELFGLPYESFLVVYPQSKAVTSTTGNVISHIPLPGAGLAGFIKEKRRYLIVQFSDPDVDVKGVVNFKLEDKETLDAVIQAMAEKAGLQQRGDAFYKPKATKKDT